MSAIENFFTQLTKMQWSDYLDIIVVAYLIYRLLPLMRSSGGLRIGLSVGALLVATWVTDLLNLHTLNFLLQQVLSVGLIAVVVLFQPELRRMVDNVTHSWWKRYKPVQEMDMVISQTVMACEAMSRERVGALIVFARKNTLEDYTKTGTPIDGQASEQLIRNIFFPKASLHDGAMIVRGGRVAAAGCVLPLSHSHKLSADLGTRHRAGVGMSEASDAVVVIVSEETGTISVAVDGVLKRYLAPQMLEQILRRELLETTEDRAEGLFNLVGGKTKEVLKSAKAKMGGKKHEE